MARKFFISPSTLNIFLDCPRCFWFHVVKGEGFRRPEQPSSTLPRKMDDLIKDYFDGYRKQNLLPPEVSGLLKGALVKQGLLDKWRSWKTGLRFVDSDGNELFGALDECLITDNVYIPVDYKTRGFELKEDSTSYYILQMSCYNFLLGKNSYPVSSYAYLLYYILADLGKAGLAKFKIELRRVETFPLDKVYRIFRDAIDVLSAAAPPQPHKECSFCNWAQRVTNLDKEQLKLF
jgi:hypothetical protein